MNGMPPTATLPRLPRADAPRPTSWNGFFSFAPTHLRGLSLPFWLLQMYVFLSMSMVDEHWMATIGVLRPRFLIGSLTLVLLVGRALTGRDERSAAWRAPPTQWLMAFLLVCFLSMLWAFKPEYARKPFLEHFNAIMLFGLLVSIVRTRRELLITVLVFCAGIGLYLVVSTYEWFGGRYDPTMNVIRMMGAGQSLADPNSFGATVVFGWPLVAWAALRSRSRWIKLGAMLYGALMVYAVFKTSSRSALVLGSLAGVWTLCVLPRGWPRVTGIVVTVAAALVMIGTLSDSQIERIQSLVSARTYEKEASTVGRLRGYEVAWEMFTENPALGVGPGSWADYRQGRIDGSRLQPHNLVGQTLATYGALGFLTFFGFLGSTALFGLRERSRRRKNPRATAWDHAVSSLLGAMLFSIFLLLVSGLGAHNVMRTNWYWASALMLIACTCRQDDEEEATT